MSVEHYEGSCQCGAVAFEVDLDLEQTATCNCSRCQRLGAVMAFAPRATFSLRSGEESLTEYRFNKKEVQHLFCKVCGIQAFGFGKRPADGAEVVAVNVNTLESVDPRALSPRHFDGRSL